MNQEMRVCQNCHTSFVIDPSDFDFYKKIAVPAPTWCPECRLARRAVTRNERSLYRRVCDLCDKSIVARYSPEAPQKVYCPQCWWSDKWDPLDYGLEYDFSKPFFAQFKELFDRVPHLGMFITNCVNSDYCSYGFDSKNAYLSSSVVRSENVFYSNRVDDSTETLNSFYVQRGERVSDVIDSEAISNIAFGRYVKNSLDSRFLYDARNVAHCFGCVNTRNAKYRIFNKQYMKEEYEKKMAEYDLGSYAIFQKVKKDFMDFSLRYPRRCAMIDKCSNVKGDNIRNSKLAVECFDINGAENCKFVVAGLELKDCHDLFFAGLNNAELCYEATSSTNSGNKFSVGAHGFNMEYCYYCLNRGSSNLFGCVSMPHKRDYCVLNRQYASEEYEKLAARIRNK